MTEAFGLPTEGKPVHLVREVSHQAMAWCGVRMQFRHRVAKAEDANCRACLAKRKRLDPNAMTTGREKPWRAIAYVPDPTGQTTAGRKRVVAGRTSARTEDGLAPFLARHGAAGNVVDVEYVGTLEDAQNG